MQERKWQVLSGSQLKLIGAACMLLDHVGELLFPRIRLFRILGRLAYPIFAFMIAEGCRYTRNKLRYFLMVFALGVGCQAVYFLTTGDTKLNILLTFSWSVLLIYALQAADHAEGWKKEALWSFTFAACFLGVYGLDQIVQFDYGFWGVMTPVFVSFAHLQKWPNWAAVLLLGIGLVLVGTDYVPMQNYALLALPLLLLYSGEPGKHRMKYFFYIFYPVHLAVLQGIAWLVR